VSKNEKVVKDIIARYGETLNLKKSPYIMVEIIRQYGPRLGGVRMACLPPGGPPKLLDPSEIMKELKVKAAEVTRLTASFEKAIRTRAKR
jgi:hypothetical protein